MGKFRNDSFKKFMKKIGIWQQKDSEKSRIDENTFHLILWDAFPYFPLFFMGIGYWYMVYDRELKMKYQFLCHEINICREKIQIIEEKQKAKSLGNIENYQIKFLCLDKFKRILEKFLNY
jgi:hypothetical protein